MPPPSTTPCWPQVACGGGRYLVLTSAHALLLSRDEDNATRLEWHEPLVNVGAAEQSSSEVVLHLKGGGMRFVPCVGGAPAVRPFWRRYAAPETRALVWVVDASDAARLAESAAALAPMLAEPRLARLPLLVFANKADVGGWDAGVVTDDAITAALGLGGRAECQLVRCSAVDGRGVADGFEWLASSDNANGYVVIQEDSGNDFGERTFISKVEIGTPMTYYFIAMSGGDESTRAMNNCVPAGTCTYGAGHEFSGVTDLTGTHARQEHVFGVSASFDSIASHHS